MSVHSWPFPQHVAIIMDGNGRWARARGLPRPAGHRAGVEPVRLSSRSARAAQDRRLTLFAFQQRELGAAPPTGRQADGAVRGCAGAGDRRTARQWRAPALHRRARACWVRSSARASTALRAHRRQHGLKLQIAVSLRRPPRHRECRAPACGRCASGRAARRRIDEALPCGRAGPRRLPDPDLFIRTGASSASAISCCGTSPTRSCISPTALAGFRRAGLSRRRWRIYGRRASGASD